MTGRRASSTRIRKSRLRRCTVLPAGTQVLGPQVIGNEPEPLDSEKDVTMKPERSSAQLAVGSRSTVQRSRTTDSGRQTRSGSGLGLLYAGDHPVNETRTA